MSEPHGTLADLLIQRLEDMKGRGQSRVRVSPEIWEALQAGPSAPAPAPASRPAPVARPAESPQPRERTRPQPAPVPPVSPTPQTIARPAARPAPAPVAVAPTLSGDKARDLAHLRERALVCQKCPHLVSSRTQVVFGVGSMDASLMLVGEAPGADEDLQGEPFVGKAGQLLTKIIQTMGLSREGVYIANILKCRPDTPGQRYGNRPPTPEEMSTCMPYLHAQIDLIQPKVLVALGKTALQGLLGESVSISKARGHWREFRGIPLMPTYHPSYVLRNQALSTKREIWEDMLGVMERLAMPISERQRGFFLPK